MKRVRVEGISVDVWCAAHDLEVTNDWCTGCGAPCKINVPLMVGDLPGLASDPCVACGNERMPFMFSVQDGSARA